MLMPSVLTKKQPTLLVAFMRCLADSNRRRRFCRPLTKPLIQGTVASFLICGCKGTTFYLFYQMFCVLFFSFFLLLSAFPFFFPFFSFFSHSLIPFSLLSLLAEYFYVLSFGLSSHGLSSQPFLSLRNFLSYFFEHASLIGQP